MVTLHVNVALIVAAVSVPLAAVAIVILLKGTRNMAALDDGLNAALAKAKAETTVLASVQAYVITLKQQLTDALAAAANAGATPEQLATVQQINDTLDANAAAAAVITNTPAATDAPSTADTPANPS